MSDLPTVSALVITHNRASLLKQCIASALAQSHPVHEMIVIDDGSDEDIEAIVTSFDDRRLKYHRFSRIAHLPRLRNIAVSFATGDFLAFIDSDDLWRSDKIARCLKAASDTGADFIFSDSNYVDADGNIGRRICGDLDGSIDVFNQMLIRRKSLAFASNLFFSKKVIGGRQCFDESFQTGEHDFVMRMTAVHKSRYIPEPLNYIRRHKGNITAEGSAFDFIAPAEYNRTLKTLYKSGKVTWRTWKKEHSENLVKLAGAHMVRNRFLRAISLSTMALLTWPRLYTAKILLKSALLLVGVPLRY
jgi:glycosyltransferase involved in cell wall biosynthesis